MPKEVSVPRHYRLLLKDFKEIKGMIERALIDRPQIMEDSPWDRYDISQFFDGLDNSIDNISNAFNRLSDEVLQSSEEEMALIELKEYMTPIYKEVSFLREKIYTLWERPFPPELFEGQILLSELMEKPLRQIWKIFDEFISIIEDPDGYIEKYGSNKITLNLTFDIEKEAEALLNWIKRISYLHDEDISKVKSESCSFASLALAFMLGKWWGSH